MKLLLVLSQLCVFEADFTDGKNEDCAAIVQVLRARNLLSSDGAHRYSPHFRTAKWREWIHHLNLNGDKPARWPARRSWKRYQSRWFNTIAQVSRGLAGYAPCPVGTKHWGAPGFRASYWRSLGWRPQQCGQGTRNWFWRRVKKKRHLNTDTSLLSPYGRTLWFLDTPRAAE